MITYYAVVGINRHFARGFQFMQQFCFNFKRYPNSLEKVQSFQVMPFYSLLNSRKQKQVGINLETPNIQCGIGIMQTYMFISLILCLQERPCCIIFNVKFVNVDYFLFLMNVTQWIAKLLISTRGPEEYNSQLLSHKHIFQKDMRSLMFLHDTPCFQKRNDSFKSRSST